MTVILREVAGATPANSFARCSSPARVGSATPLRFAQNDGGEWAPPTASAGAQNTACPVIAAGSHVLNAGTYVTRLMATQIAR